MFPETYWTSHPADAQERLKISHGSLDPVLSGKTGSFIGFAGQQIFRLGGSEDLLTNKVSLSYLQGIAFPFES